MTARRHFLRSTWAGLGGMAIAGPPDDVFRLVPRALGTGLRISIAHVNGASANERGDALLLYLLDPSFNFAAAAAVAGFLAGFARIAGGRWRPVTVVGVGYDDDDPAFVMKRRALDLTPTSAPAPPGVHLPPLSFGGGPAFLEALTQDVMPAVEARLPPAGPRVLVGHSFGGLFGLHALFHSSRAFDGYLLVSPSLWWDDRIALRDCSAWNASHAARVFLAVGENEQAPGGGWRNEGFPDEAIRALRQVDNFRELVAALERRSRPGLTLRTAVLPDEYHLTVFPAAFGRGLRFMVDAFPD